MPQEPCQGYADNHDTAGQRNVTTQRSARNTMENGLSVVSLCTLRKRTYVAQSHTHDNLVYSVYPYCQSGQFIPLAPIYPHVFQTAFGWRCRGTAGNPKDSCTSNICFPSLSILASPSILRTRSISKVFKSTISLLGAGERHRYAVP